MFFKLGIRNACQIKKQTDTVARFHDNSYDAGPGIIQTKIPRCYLKQASSTPKNLMGRAKTIRGPCVFRARPSIPLYRFQMGIFVCLFVVFLFTKKTGTKRVASATTKMDIILSFFSFSFFVEVKLVFLIYPFFSS